MSVAPTSVCMSVLMPAASSTKLAQRTSRVSNVEQVCEQVLDLSKDHFQLFALVPLKDEHLKPDALSQNPEIAIRLTESDFSLKNVEEIISQRDKNRDLLAKTNEALLTYVGELKRMRKFLVDSGCRELEEETNKESVSKKTQKSKELEEDNKKLRKLLKTQLENSENLRMETQNTVETLREEFDQLVKELVNYKRMEAGGAFNSNKSSPSQPLIGQGFSENQLKSDGKNKRDSSGSGQVAGKKEQSEGAASKSGGGMGVPKLKLNN